MQLSTVAAAPILVYCGQVGGVDRLLDAADQGRIRVRFTTLSRPTVTGTMGVGMPHQKITLRTVATMKTIAVTPARDEALTRRLEVRDETALTGLVDRCSSMMYGACPKGWDCYKQW